MFVVCSLNHVCRFATPWMLTHQALLSMDFPRQEYWSEWLFYSPGIFPTQGSGPHFPHCQVDSLLLSHQFSSVDQSCLTFCDPVNCSTPGFPVHHQLLELLRLMSMEKLMPSDHLILCLPLLLPSSIFPSIRVFSNESVLHIRWPKYWSFSFNISPSNEHPGMISQEAGKMVWYCHLLQNYPVCCDPHNQRL